MASGSTALPSLKGRLLRGLLAPLLILTLVGTAADYEQARQLSDESHDQVLASTAMGLASRLEMERDGDLLAHMDKHPRRLADLDAAHSMTHAVFDARGRLVAGLAELQALIGRPPAPSEVAFHDEQDHGQDLRVAVYAYRGPEGAGTIVVAETLHQRQQAVRTMMGSIVWTNLLLVCVTLSVVWWAVRHALRPLNELGHAMAVREPQDLSPLPGKEVPQEVEALVSATNQLMERVRQAALSQQAFLSNTAHQLRTPLAGLQTQLELLHEDLPPQAAERLTPMLDSVHRLGHLTHQMLALARAAPQAQVQQAHETVDLCRLLEDVASAHIDQALARGIDLGFEARPACVSGSAWMLRELLSNLVDNALNHTPAGGRVTVSCGPNDAGLPTLQVEDNGPGIPPTERPKVFERFYRATDSTTPGTGLGLAIVQEIASQHGAHIHLSDGPGQRGTAFQLVFPPHPA